MPGFSYAQNACVEATVILSYWPCDRDFKANIVGLLEDLEQEAQQRKVSADDVERLKMEREEVFKKQLDPGMSALYEYLTKLVGSLKILQPKKALRFTLGG